jgi:hypothetical protein
MFTPYVHTFCSQVREIVRMALSGLEALHHQRVVHRDLKPESEPCPLTLPDEHTVLRRAV